MRLELPLAVLMLSAAGPALADCKGEVQTALEKQRKQAAYRMLSEMAGTEGMTSITVDFVAPDKMHQTLQGPGVVGLVETIAVSRWVWGNQGSGWQELQPQFAQPVTASVREALVDPLPAVPEFTCLGSVTYAGKSYLGYKAKVLDAGDAPPDRGVAADPAGKLERTLYVDSATGLPAYNVLAEANAGDAFAVRRSFTYGGAITVEAPVDISVKK